MLLFTRCATSNASRHFKSPLAMGRDAFKSKRASSVSISGVIDTGVNSNKNIFKKQSALLIFLIDGIIIALIRNHTVFRRIKEWRIYYNGEKKH